MTIRDLINQFEIQGAYLIATYNETDERIIVAEGYKIEIECSNIEDKYLDTEISYMYAEDNVLVIEMYID